MCTITIVSSAPIYRMCTQHLQQISKIYGMLPNTRSNACHLILQVQIPTRTALHDSNLSFLLFVIYVTLWNSVYLTFANKVAYTWPRTFCTTKLKLAVWTFKRSGNSLLRYVSQSFNCSHLLSGSELIFPYARDATYNLRINNSSMLELVWTWRHSNMFNVEQ